MTRTSTSVGVARVRAGTTAAAVAGAAVLALAAPAAHAEVIERGTYPFSGGPDSLTCDRGTADPSDDFELVATSSGEETVTLKERGPGLDVVFFTGKGSSTSVITGLGMTWTATNHYLAKDQRLLPTEGSVDAWVFGATQQVTVYDPDGHKDSAFASRVEYLVTYDTSTGDEPVWTEIKQVGHNTLGEPCEDAIRFAANS